MDLGRHAAKELRKLGIRVDWRATFLAFVDLHGPPVRWGGRLLFQDGWTHALDYRGPEWPPPSEPADLRRMQLDYQRLKRKALKMEVDWLAGVIATFDEWARLKSAGVQLSREVGDADAQGSHRREPVSAASSEELRGARDRLRDSARELRACEAEIERLEAPPQEVKEEKVWGAINTSTATTAEQLGDFDE